MHFEPSLILKRLSQTKPGELIRLWWGSSTLAFVAASNDIKYLVFLDKLPEQPNRLCYLPVLIRNGDKDDIVISYGNDWILELSQEPKFIDVLENKYADVPGAILVALNARLLAVPPMAKTHIHGTLYYDLESGTISPQGYIPGRYFGKWQLWLPRSTHLPDERSPISKFELQPVS